MTKLKKKYPPVLDEFIDDGWIEEVVSVVKSGKEATVYCCRACESIGREYIAAKIYREHAQRSFKNDSIYQEGRVIVSGRMQRAVAKKSSFGREVQQALWTGVEYATLQLLHSAGAIVPQPLHSTGDAILLEYIGDGVQPGKPLYAINLEPAQAQRYQDLLLDQISLWLRCNRIHGDLSPYNILHTKSRGITVIDFPQAVDPRESPHARDLLLRDVRNVTEHFEAFGVEPINVERFVQGLWSAWKFGRLS